MTIGLDLEIRKLEGFEEAELINVLKKSLSGCYANNVTYQSIPNGYRFEVDFTPVISAMSYQAILGCFQTIGMDYDKVELIGIPQDKITLR